MKTKVIIDNGYLGCFDTTFIEIDIPFVPQIGTTFFLNYKEYKDKVLSRYENGEKKEILGFSRFFYGKYAINGDSPSDVLLGVIEKAIIEDKECLCFDDAILVKDTIYDCETNYVFIVLDDSAQ